MMFSKFTTAKVQYYFYISKTTHFHPIKPHISPPTKKRPDFFEAFFRLISLCYAEIIVLYCKEKR